MTWFLPVFISPNYLTKMNAEPVAYLAKIQNCLRLHIAFCEFIATVILLEVVGGC